jgi:acetyltransferase-like isoleucine patch superfamily enzyme
MKGRFFLKNSHCNQNGLVRFEKNVTIHDNVLIDYSGGITIGHNTKIHRNTIILTHEHKHFERNEKTFSSKKIENNVFIGMNCLVLGSCYKISENSFISAGCILNKSIESPSQLVYTRLTLKMKEIK